MYPVDCGVIFPVRSPLPLYRLYCQLEKKGANL